MQCKSVREGINFHSLFKKTYLEKKKKKKQTNKQKKKIKNKTKQRESKITTRLERDHRDGD